MIKGAVYNFRIDYNCNENITKISPCLLVFTLLPFKKKKASEFYGKGHFWARKLLACT